MKTAKNCKILSHVRVAEATMELRLDFREETVLPGQFVQVRVPRADCILRRPISVHCHAEGVLTLVYQVKGKGTQALAALQPGDEVDVLGPLGNGFPVGAAKRIWVVGGGIGCAPLYGLPIHYPDVAFDAILGYRTASLVFREAAYRAAFARVDLVTDDGTAGRQGNVADVLKERLAQARPDAIFACGPKPMFRALKQALEGEEIPCWLSLEERMGCGVGACVTCACAVMKNGERQYLRVCADGPVFPLQEVLLDD